MDLKEKKINCLGDSITEGYGTTHIENTYWNRLAANTGATVRGYGIGGTRIARQHSPSENPVYDRWFCSRVSEMDPDADVIVVFGGTNDYGHGDAPFGTPEDRTDDTFCGAVHTLCRLLIERYPAATIVLMTPAHRADEFENGRRLADYVAAEKAIAAQYSLPVLDLWSMGGMCSAIDAQRDLYYVPDGLHLSDAGHARVEQRLRKFLESL